MSVLSRKNLNNEIKRKYYQILNVEIISKLAGIKYYSTLDATSGLYQIKLNEESSKLCTFETHLGDINF